MCDYMYISVAEFRFSLPGNNSLKGKRQISRSLIQRLRQRLALSVAEVGAIDLHRFLVIGVSAISKDLSYAEELVSAAIRFVEDSQMDVALMDVQRTTFQGP